MLSSRAQATEINKNFQPSDQIALYGDIRVAASIGFYTHPRLWLYNAEGRNLEYGSHDPDAPEVVVTDADFPICGTEQGEYSSSCQNRRTKMP